MREVTDLKKIITIFMMITLIVVNFLVVSIFQSIDYRRISEIEKTNFSFNFYLSNVNRTNQEHLTFLSELSKDQQISIVKTDQRNDIFVKSVIVDRPSFPFAQFDLENQELFDNEKNIYGNVQDFEGVFVGRIPTFYKGNKIVLQSLAHYYRESDKSINGVYTIVSLKKNDKQGIIKKLSEFYGIDQKKIVTANFGSVTSILTASLIYLLAVLVMTLLIVSMAIVYVPLTEVKKIGVMKLLGHSEKNIFFTFTKQTVLYMLILSVLFDLFFFFSQPYIPKKIMMTFVIAQLSLILLFLALNSMTYLIIRKVTASKMLKNYLELKVGVVVAYVLKALLMGVVTVIFLQISLSIDELIQNYQTSQNWQEVSQYLTIEMDRIMPGNQLDLSTSNPVQEQQTANAFRGFEEELKAMYISSSKVDPGSFQFAAEEGPTYQLSQEYELVTMNYNFLESLPIKHQRSDSETREFLIPESNRELEDWPLFARTLLYQSMSNQEQEGLGGVENIAVKISYYPDQNFSLFPYHSDYPENFKKPILVVFDSKNQTIGELRALQTTGINNPLKIVNSKQNRQRIKELLTVNGITEIVPQFSTIDSILTTQLSFAKGSLIVTVSILLVISLLSCAASSLLMYLVIKSERTKLITYTLLGFKVKDKYKNQWRILLALSSVQVIFIGFFSQSILITVSLLCVLGLDLLLTWRLLRFQEKKNLVTSLKGA